MEHILTHPRPFLKSVLLAIVSGGLAASGCFADPAIAESSSTTYFGEGSANPDTTLSLGSGVEDWYKDAVVYHLWVAAFRDSDGDGIGDLPGIIQELDTLKSLGIDTLWLSPFFANASNLRNLHGYDVTDFHQVDPRLGTNDAAAALLREAHARGMRVIFDFVPNHLSSRHPWFIESRDPESPKRDWFLWRDERPENGWTGFNDSSDWHADPAGGYYYGIFWSGMPDLNHRNPEVRQALAQAARHWLDLGFDGIRMDAVKYLFEDLDGPGKLSDQENQPETINWFQAWRHEVMDAYANEGYPKFMVAENWTDNRRDLLAYSGDRARPAFHMTLNFPLLPALNRLDPGLATDLWKWDATLPPHAWLGNFTSNHDMAADRPGTLFAGDSIKQRAQAAWLLLGPGTPFVYYGNEIGQPQGNESGDRRHRHPLDWDELRRQRKDPASLWHWHRELIELRHARPSLRRGKARFLQTSAGPEVMALWREVAGDTTLTLLNGSAEPLESLTVVLPEDYPGDQWRWLLGKGSGVVAADTSLETGPLAPHEVKVLAPEAD